MEHQPAFVSILQAGEYLGVKRSSVYRLLSEGKLASARLGNRRLVTFASVQQLATKLMEAE